MASYDYVSLPGAPDLTKMPQVDFSWLGNLPKQYQQGQQYGYQRAQQTAFPNGIPTDANGIPDYNSILNTVAKTGGVQAVQGLLPQLMNMRLGDQAAEATRKLYPQSGNGTQFPNNGGDTGNGGSTGAPGGAQPAPQSAQQPPTQPSQGSPPPFMGTSRPTGNAIGQAPSIRETVAANGGTDQQALAFAARLGIDPNAPISQQDAPRVGRLLMTAGIGRPIGQRVADAATNQETGPISTGEVSAQAGETNSTQGQNATGPAAAAPGPSIPGTAGGGPAAAGRDSVPQPGSTPPGGTRYPPGITPQIQQQLQQRAAAAHTEAARVQFLNPKAAEQYENIAKAAETQFNDNQKAISDYNAPTGPQKESAGMGYGNDVASSEGAKGYAAEQGKAWSAVRAKFQTAKEEADTERPQLALVSREMNSPGFYSGAAAGLIQKYRQWTVALGGDPNAGTPQEAFGKAVQNLALSQIRSMAGTGPVRVAEMNIIQKAIANKDYTPATNRLLVEIADRNYKRSQDIDGLATQYEKKNGRLDSGFSSVISQYDQQHPLFSDKELNDTRLVAPPRFRSRAEAESAGLPSQSPYVDMNGKGPGPGRYYSTP